MKFLFIFWALGLGAAHADGELRYDWLKNEKAALTLQAKSQGTRQALSLPLQFCLNSNHSTGLTVSVERDSTPQTEKKYMFNWYLKKNFTRKLTASMNVYGDKMERDQNLAYGKVNAGLTLKLGPRLNLNFESYAGRSFGNKDLTINHVLGTALTF